MKRRLVALVIAVGAVVGFTACDNPVGSTGWTCDTWGWGSSTCKSALCSDWNSTHAYDPSDPQPCPWL